MPRRRVSSFPSSRSAVRFGAAILVTLAAVGLGASCGKDKPNDGSTGGQGGGAAGAPAGGSTGGAATGGGAGLPATGGSTGGTAGGAATAGGGTAGGGSGGQGALGGVGGSRCLDEMGRWGTLLYISPGCTNPTAYCVSAGGACGGLYCGCDGVVRSDGCHSSGVPWSHQEPWSGPYIGFPATCQPGQGGAGMGGTPSGGTAGRGGAGGGGAGGS